ncbi:tetratricopeptide repeat protein [Roseibacterium beibuensis]|uniref:ATP-binding protein n=1 Tax=[Roseibacterium] beibuensis TaxID=1193142 RepID=UPI00217DFD54|nr:ATP-binding protein [Roseibacterium beibuensis]MCS6626466.1 tetratricopeptide repeat protein [Roseibacterium beibuensis]
MANFKYNPGFLPDGDLLTSLHVRRSDLDIVLEIVHDNHIARSNRHILIVGPRGLGKTTLVRTVAATVRLDDQLRAAWYPVVFGEESYGISSAGEFWLEAIYHIAEQEADASIEADYQRLRKQLEPSGLEAACIDYLCQYSVKIGRRLLIVVENINDIFDSQLTEEDGWAVRHALQTRPELMLLATATTSFDQIDSVDKALFEQFKVHRLEPLRLRDCQLLWKALTGVALTDREIRPVQILTGGNPRLLRIWAEFSQETSFEGLLLNVSHLVDDYTDYFRSQLEYLPAAERKVFVSLLSLWDPCTTREVAECARVPVNLAAAQLARLERRGAITRLKSQQTRWQASERLFNIYYLMRRRGTPSSRVEALVRFMTAYYAPDQLLERARGVAQEACQLAPSHRKDHYFALAGILQKFDQQRRNELLVDLPVDFLDDPEVPVDLRRLYSSAADAAGREAAQGGDEDDVSTALRRASGLVEAHRYEEALDIIARRSDANSSAHLIFSQALLLMLSDELSLAEQKVKEALRLEPSNPGARVLLGRILKATGRTSEAVDVLRTAIEGAPNDGMAWTSLAEALLDMGESSDEAEIAINKAISIHADRPYPLSLLARLYSQKGDEDAALKALRTAVDRFPADPSSWGRLGDFYLNEQHELAAAEEAFRTASELVPADYVPLLRRAQVISHFDERKDEAVSMYEAAVALAADDVSAYINYVRFLLRSEQIPEAIAVAHRATKQFPNDAQSWMSLAQASERGENIEDAERYYKVAVESDNADAIAWEALGMFYSRVSRFPEARNATLRAIALSSDECSPLHSLGLISQSEGNDAEAIEGFKRALACDPKCACALKSLREIVKDGRSDFQDIRNFFERAAEGDPQTVLHRVLFAQLLLDAGQAGEALVQLRSASTKGVPSYFLWEQTARLLSDPTVTYDDAKGLADELLNLAQRTPEALNSIAWAIISSGAARLLALATSYALEAHEKDNGNWAILHTLVMSLAADGRVEDALEKIPQLLRGLDSNRVTDFIDVCVELARRGAAKGVLNLLKVNEADAEILEPLVVALRMVEGQELYVAAEVQEVAGDIAARIEAVGATTVGR